MHISWDAPFSAFMLLNGRAYALFRKNSPAADALGPALRRKRHAQAAGRFASWFRLESAYPLSAQDAMRRLLKTRLPHRNRSQNIEKVQKMW
jgi:hypothetical protein